KLTAKTLKALAPHAVTDAIEAVARRMPLSKMKKIAARGWMLSGALATRFNRVAQAKVSAVARELGELRDDVVDAGRDFMKAVEGALSDAAGTAMQRENERLAALIIAEERQRALEAEEARLAAEKEAEKGAEKPAEEAVTEEKAEQGSAAAEFAAKAQGTAQDSAAVKRRKIESMERHRAEEKRQTHTNTMKAKPD
ncbi:MAG: hypothetical protein KKA05_05060, partial [Alphaproteobacteria bacterium]|nr:hypothetical protein [Alphaproteobacteria bacterium]